MKSLCCALALMAGCSSLGAQQLSMVRGRIVDVRSGQGMSGAVVALSDIATRKDVAEGLSAGDGAFEFRLPPGRYLLRGGTKKIQNAFGMAPWSGFGSQIIVEAGRDVDGLVLRWYAHGAVTGIILDDNGDPAPGMRLQLIHPSVVNGVRTGRSAAFAFSDDRGQYRFGNVLPGEYYLMVSGQTWYATGLEEHADLPTGYVATYYPGVPEASRAGLLRVAPGAEVKADFRLTAVRAVRVTVQVGDSSGLTGSIRLTSDGPEGSESFSRADTYRGGPLQVFSGVPPGHYVLKLAMRRGGESLAAIKELDVASADVEAEVVLRPAAGVRGRVTAAAGASPLGGTSAVALFDRRTGASVSGPIMADGSFAIPAVAPGVYRIAPQLRNGYYAEGIQISGARSVDGEVHVEPDNEFTINMVVNDNSGKVAGTAVRGDAPAAAVLVLLVPQEKTLADLRTFAYQTESDGSFEWSAVPPGTYYLMALEDTGLEYKNRRVTEPLFKDGRLLQLEPKAVYREKVPVSR